MKRFQLMLPAPMRAALEKLSAETGLSIAEHIRLAITEYLRRLGRGIIKGE